MPFKKKEKSFILETKFKKILFVTIGLTIIQILLGTNVREHVDRI